MKLFNQSTNQLITNQLLIGSTIIDQTLGLINQPTTTAMLFKTRFGIHTFFMKYPIDILVLDSQLIVVKIKRALSANRLFFWNPKYFTIIEINTNHQSDIKIGHKLIVI